MNIAIKYMNSVIVRKVIFSLEHFDQNLLETQKETAKAVVLVLT